MRLHSMSANLVLLVMVALSSAIFAQTVGHPGPVTIQTSASAPDLSGIWSRRAGAKGPDFLSDSKKPEPLMTPWGEAEYKKIRESYTSTSTGYLNDPVFNCMPPGVPRVYAIDFEGIMEMIQLPGRVLQIFEFDHYVRQIYTDGRAHDESLPPTWMGDSIGKWEGDTLVVDTTGFNDKTRLDRLGHPHSDALHLIERFRRVSKDKLIVDITIEDPKAYPKPWGGQLTYALKPDWKLMEFMCQDNHTFDQFTDESAKPVN
jgi:hypothetical protein